MTTHENKWSNFKKRAGRNYIVFIVILCAVASDIVINRLMLQKYLNNQKNSVTQKLGTLRARFEEHVNTNLYIIFGLAAYISIRSNISEEEFQSLSQVLLSQGSSLKNIAAAPDFIVRYVYPHKGNEAIVGLNYREIPDQWPLALAAKESKKMVIAGPLDLVQGGKGIIARIPVFIRETDEFWGLVSSVIDFDMLMGKSGVDSEKAEINVAVRCRRSKNKTVSIFPETTDLFAAENHAIIMPVTLPSVKWEIAATPKNGWARSAPNSPFIHLSVLISAFIIGHTLFQRDMHKQVVEENEARLEAMSNASHDSLIMINSNDQITFWNPSAEKIFGYGKSEILGKTLHDIVALPAEKKKAKAGLKKFKKTGKGPITSSVRELQAIRKSGEVFPIELAVSAFKLGGAWYAVGSVRDITERKKHDEQLTFLATTDELTRISNRRNFLNLSEREFSKATRYKKQLSLAIFDIDYFKNINDTYGHDAGDELLRKISQTVIHDLRATDIVGRIGGEEFALTMPETPIHQARKIAERIRLDVMQMKVKTDTATMSVTISIGIAEMAPQIASLSELMKKADDALYKAKEKGRNQVASVS